MVLEVSKAGWFERVMAVAWLMSSMREPAFESSSAIGRGTKWSVAAEAVWRGGDGGLWRRKGWETLGSQPPTKTDSVRGQTASAAWAGTAHCWIEGSTLVAARPGTALPAQSKAGLSGLCLRQQAGRLPPRRPEASASGALATACRGWRNSSRGITKPKAYRGVEGRDSSDGACEGRGVPAWNDPAAELRKAAGCSHSTDAKCG